MSSFDRRTLIALPLVLVACGFTPIYGPDGGGSALFGQVLVDAPETRDEYLLVQALEQRLGQAAAPKYGLSQTLGVTRQGLAINAEGDITRIQLLGTVAFSLRDLETDAIVFSGRVENFTGYSNTGSTVETLASQTDAHARLMVILADRMLAQLFAAHREAV